MTNVLERNNVHVFGSGSQPMLFAHGFGCDQNMWRFVTPAFERDYRIVLLDYVGAGRSDIRAYDRQRYGSLEGYAQDILDVCEALSLSRVILVGHSVSSVIGMLASLQQPERFERLILVGPSPRYANDPPYIGGFDSEELSGLLEMMDKNYIGWASVLSSAAIGNPNRPELAGELEQSFCSTDPVIARQFAEITFFADNRADVTRVTTPSLIMQCSQDVLAPLDVGRYLHEHMVNSTLRVLQAAGHCPHMSHPEETIAVIKEYLSGERERVPA